MFLLVGAEDEREFDYVQGGDKGPDRWGEIHEEWSMCKHGNMQSPIDLLNERVEVVSHLGRLQRSYKPSQAILRNRGHDMMVRRQTFSDIWYETPRVAQLV